MSVTSPAIPRMPRMTLVLADVYVPTSAAPVPAAPLPPRPALEHLLRFASVTRIDSAWRTWIARSWQVTAPESWRATPVRMEARLDHVRIAEQGLVQLDHGQADALVAAFNATFDPDFCLVRSHRGDFDLHGWPPGADEVMTTDPATLLGADVLDGLARGENARRVRALSAEIEMWLHTNAKTIELGQPLAANASALWLWRAPDLGALECAPGTDWARWVRDLSAGTPAVAVLWPMTRGSLESLERDWLAPVAAHVAAGGIETLELIVNGRLFTVRRADFWKRWRRPRAWLDVVQRAE